MGYAFIRKTNSFYAVRLLIMSTVINSVFIILNMNQIMIQVRQTPSHSMQYYIDAECLQ